MNSNSVITSNNSTVSSNGNGSRYHLKPRRMEKNIGTNAMKMIENSSVENISTEPISPVSSEESSGNVS